MKKPLKIQASSLSRILKCPGSLTLESRLPDRLRYFAFKDAAEFGTLCHAVGEYALKHNGKWGIYAGNIWHETNAHPRSEDILFIGGTYADVVTKNKIPGKLFVEEKFRATIAGVDCVAKADARYVGKNRIRDFDLKSGNFDYADSASKQMDFGARIWCYLHDEKDGRKIETYTVQPAFYNEARRVVAATHAPFSRAGFVEFVEGIKARQKEFNPGAHCKMCSAILTCKLVKQITEEFFEMAKKATKEDLNFKDIYMKRDAVIAFLDALDGYLTAEMEGGKAIPGMYLEEYSGRRRWVDSGMVEEKLAYLGNKIYEPRKLKTPAQLEKIAGKVNIEGLYDTPRLKKVAIRENTFEEFAE